MNKAVEVEKGFDFSGVLGYNSEERFSGICDVLKDLGELRSQSLQIFQDDYAMVKQEAVFRLFEFLPAYVNQIDVSGIVGGEGDIFISRKSYINVPPEETDVCWNSANLIYYLSVLQKDMALEHTA